VQAFADANHHVIKHSFIESKNHICFPKTGDPSSRPVAPTTPGRQSGRSLIPRLAPVVGGVTPGQTPVDLTRVPLHFPHRSPTSPSPPRCRPSSVAPSPATSIQQVRGPPPPPPSELSRLSLPLLSDSSVNAVGGGRPVGCTAGDPGRRWQGKS
jgi:hypothetical protein